jgi:hypothetical protein
VHQRDRRAEGAQSLLGPAQHLPIAVDADELAPGSEPAQDDLGVSAQADGGVDDAGAGART